MKGFLKAVSAVFMISASSAALASSVPATDTTPQMAYEDISHSLPALEPITFQASPEKQAANHAASGDAGQAACPVPCRTTSQRMFSPPAMQPRTSGQPWLLHCTGFQLASARIAPERPQTTGAAFSAAGATLCWPTGCARRPWRPIAGRRIFPVRQVRPARLAARQSPAAR